MNWYVLAVMVTDIAVIVMAVGGCLDRCRRKRFEAWIVEELAELRMRDHPNQWKP